MQRVGDILKEGREMEKVAGERSSDKVAAAREIAKAMTEEGGRRRERRRKEERGRDRKSVV